MPLHFEIRLDQTLRENFTTEFRKGYINVDGVCLPESYRKFASDIEEFEVRNDDVWVCSFPKTGTTWTQEMVWCVANDLDFEKAKVPLPRRFPFFEYSVLFDYSTIMSRTPNMTLPEWCLNSVKYVKNLAGPRFIKTHLPFHLLPRQIRNGTKKPRIIYVARNAKDTCISYYHHCKLLEGYHGDFESFCDLFLAGKLSFAPYWDHVLSFWSKGNDSNILFLKYEDMKSDLGAVIKKTVAYLNESEMVNERFETLMKHLSFASMKSNPAVNYEEVVERNKRYKLIETDGKFIRNGTVNQWKGKMSEGIIDQFDELTMEKFVKEDLYF